MRRPRRRGVVVVGAMALALVARDASGGDRIEADVSLGFAFPAGSIERSSRLGDTASGAVPIQADGAWFLARRIALHGALAYGIGVPKLCSSPGDCEASLGRDVALELGVRLAPLDLRALAPRLDVGVGWEWYTTLLSDKGVSSSRAYSGPTFLALTLSAPLRVSDRFAMGPSVGVRAGAFTSATRTTPAWTDTSLDDTTIHAWLRLTIDARLAF